MVIVKEDTATNFADHMTTHLTEERMSTLLEVLVWLRQAIRSDLYKSWNAWALVNYQ